MLSGNKWFSQTTFVDWMGGSDHLGQKDFCLIAAVSGAICSEQSTFFPFLLSAFVEDVWICSESTSSTKSQEAEDGSHACLSKPWRDTLRCALSSKGICRPVFLLRLPGVARLGCADLFSCSGSPGCWGAPEGCAGAQQRLTVSMTSSSLATWGSTGCLGIEIKQVNDPNSKSGPSWPKGGSKSWKF